MSDSLQVVTNIGSCNGLMTGISFLIDTAGDFFFFFFWSTVWSQCEQGCRKMELCKVDPTPKCWLPESARLPDPMRMVSGHQGRIWNVPWVSCELSQGNLLRQEDLGSGLWVTLRYLPQWTEWKVLRYTTCMMTIITQSPPIINFNST